MDMCMQLCSPTTHQIWVHLANLFTVTKPNRVVHLECELHSLVQGELSADAYYHCLQQLANSLTEYDMSISDRALVQCHQNSTYTSSHVPDIHRSLKTHSQ
jgi:hypothetical protein